MRFGIHLGDILFIIEPNVKTTLLFKPFVDCFKNRTIFTNKQTNLRCRQRVGNDCVMASDGWRNVNVEMCGFEHIEDSFVGCCLCEFDSYQTE